MKHNTDLSISLAVVIASQAYFEQTTPLAYGATFQPMGRDELKYLNENLSKN